MDLLESTVAQVLIPVENLDRAIAFYRDTLGLQFLFSAPPQMSFFQSGNVRLLVGVPAADQPRQRGSAVYFQVADIQAVFQTLAERGVQFGGRPHVVHRTPTSELWLAEFKDPDGNPAGADGSNLHTGVTSLNQRLPILKDKYEVVPVTFSISCLSRHSLERGTR